jgi:phage baseplate assembly protein W
MPYVSLTINPIQYNASYTNQQTQIYKGFSTVNNNSSSVLYDYDLIKQDIINQFNVHIGERLMRPDYGTVIWSLLFEPFTSAVKTKIISDVTRIANSDPRANALQIDVVEQEYGILLEVTLQYSGSDQTDVLKLSFDNNIGLVSTQ